MRGTVWQKSGADQGRAGGNDTGGGPAMPSRSRTATRRTRKFAIAAGLRRAAFLVELTRPELRRQSVPNLGLLRWGVLLAEAGRDGKWVSRLKMLPMY